MKIPRRYSMAVLLTLVTVLAGHLVWRTGFLDSVLRPFAGVAGFQALTYELSRERWTRFALPGAQEGEVKLITNAGVNPEEALLPPTQDLPVFAEPFYHYAVDYQVLDKLGNVIDEGRYHHRTQILRAVLEPGGEPLPVSRFAPRYDTQPAGSQRFRVEVGQEALAGTLQLRIGETGPGVEEVVVRAFVRDIVPQHQIATRWLRLSRFQQENLADDILYSYELMYPEEKENLIRNRWRPIGPQGVGGQDYFARRLYSLSEPELEYTHEPVLPAGLYVDTGRRGVLPLPPGPGRVELTFEPFTPALAQPSPPRPVTLTWFGQTLSQRVTRRLDDPARPLRADVDFLPGVIEVQAEEPLVVRLFRHAPEGSVELTPLPQYLRLYRVDPLLPPLEFVVDHVGPQSTPFRLDLRTAGLREPDGSLHAEARYTLLDAQGGVLHEGVLPSAGEISAYDRPASAVESGWVTEPTSHYFSLSPRVRTVRITGSAVAWATAYTRVDDLPARVDTGDYAPWASPTERLPFWFLTRPVETASLTDLRPTLLIERQDRPPGDDPDAAAGQYDWEWVRPAGVWVGREILAPLLPGQQVRDAALGSVFRPLPAGPEVTLRLAGDAGIPRVTPRLLYLRPDDAGPLRVQLWVDGVQVMDRQITGKSGELRLPTVDVGLHRLRLAAAGGARWLISNAGAGEEGWLQRTAQRLTPARSLRLDFEKRSAGPETLSARVFLPATEAFAQLRVRVGRGNAPRDAVLPGWTVAERFYDVAPAIREAGYLLHGGHARVSSGGRVFVRLEQDLPPGVYPLEVTLTAGSEAYVQFFRVTPGLVERQDMIKFTTDES